jgi:hypothetical protein
MRSESEMLGLPPQLNASRTQATQARKSPRETLALTVLKTHPSQKTRYNQDPQGISKVNKVLQLT